MFYSNKRVIFTIFLSLLSYISVFAASDNHHKNDATYLLKRFYVSDSEAKVMNLTVAENTGNIIDLDVPSLNTKEFSDLINPYFGKPITTELVNKISQTITNYLSTHVKLRVNVLVPPQSVTKGELRYVVVLGSYTLSRLILSSSETRANEVAINEHTSQVMLDDLPQELITPRLSEVLSPYFSKPITPEVVNQLISDLSVYIKDKNLTLATVNIPNQSTEGGVLRLALKIGVYPLKRIILANDSKAGMAIKTTASSYSVIAEKLPLYSTTEFKQYIASYNNKPITLELIAHIRQALVDYAKKHDLALVDTSYPVIDLDQGELRLAVSIGTYKQLHFKGNRFFSDKLLEQKLGIHPGDEVKISELENAVDWANQNPFRQIQVLIDTINKPLGVADLDVDVREIRPYRFAASYSNAINNALGSGGYNASVQIGNLWGLDHQISFQYNTNNTPRLDQSFSLDYKAPLPWHHYLTLDVAYSYVSPQDLFGYKGFNETAKNTITDLRYDIPLKRGVWSFDFSGGLDYKQVNTNLEFGPLTQPVATYDVAQFVLGTTAIRKDKYGSWTLGLSGYVSPGGLNSRDTSLVYGINSNTGSPTNRAANYEYARFVFERDTALPKGIELVTRAQLQYTTTNLQSSEQMNIGGNGTVRGYGELLPGDQGLILNQEIRGPVFQHHIPFTQKKSAPLSSRLIVFIDYGHVSYKHPSKTDFPMNALMGWGPGIRFSLGNNFSMAFDYGWQILKSSYYESQKGRGSFSTSLSY